MASRSDGSVRFVDPLDALERIAGLLSRSGAPHYKSEAFKKAASTVARIPDEDLRTVVAAGRLKDLPGIGARTEQVIMQALADQVPSYLHDLQKGTADPDTTRAGEVMPAVRGDLHLHSNWSDGGASVERMATRARDIGHEYLAVTDHSPRLRVAHGLSKDRLVEQLNLIEELNEELAPLRILTGIEVDILDDGSLDQSDELLARLDVVVASVHSKLRMDTRSMTRRMVRAVENPHTDILGHCTGRMVVGKGRPESEFDAAAVFATCAEHDKALEINSRPERLDPPSRLLRQAVDVGTKIAIDSDAHSPHQLEWQPYGAHRAAVNGVPVDRIVNTWPVGDLLAWTASHAA